MRATCKQMLVAIVITIGAGIVFVVHRSSTANAQPVVVVEPPPAVVGKAAATATRIVPLQWVPGSVSRRHDARIASGESELVISVSEVGTKVQRGAVLARVEDKVVAGDVLVTRGAERLEAGQRVTIRARPG